MLSKISNLKNQLNFIVKQSNLAQMIKHYIQTEVGLTSI